MASDKTIVLITGTSFSRWESTIQDRHADMDIDCRR